MSAKRKGTHAFKSKKEKMSSWEKMSRKNKIIIVSAALLLLAVLIILANLCRAYDGCAFLEGRLPYYNDAPHGIEENDIIAEKSKSTAEFYKLGTYTSRVGYPVDADYGKGSRNKYETRWTYRPENGDGVYLVDLFGLVKDAAETRDQAVAYFPGCTTLDGKTANGLTYAALLTAPGYWDDLGAYNTTFYAYIPCGDGCVQITVEAKADTADMIFGPELFIRYLDEVAAGIKAG